MSGPNASAQRWLPGVQFPFQAFTVSVGSTGAFAFCSLILPSTFSCCRASARVGSEKSLMKPSASGVIVVPRISERGEALVVQREGALPAGDDRVALVELHPHGARDRALRRIDHGVERVPLG